MEYETVKEMYTDLRGGLSPEGRISLAGSRCGYVCDRFEFTQDGAEISIYLAAARSHSGIFLWGVPDGQADVHLRGGDPKAELVNDARLSGFPATHLEPYSQA